MRSQNIIRKSQQLLRKSAQPHVHPILNSRSRPCLAQAGRSPPSSNPMTRPMSYVAEESVQPSSSDPPPPTLSETPEDPPKEEPSKELGAADTEVAQAEELAKVKIRRTRNVAAPKDAETVELPEELDIFWLPEEANLSDSAAHVDLPPQEVLEEAFNNLLITLHPQVQHRATYSTGTEPPVEPTLGLYCPIEGGDYVIDATVRELARRADAEVLVLDTVQLAAGEWGNFGKAANSLQLPVNPLHLPSEVVSPLQSRSQSHEMEDDDEDGDMFPSQRLMTLTLLAQPQGRSLVSSNTRRAASKSSIKVFFDTLLNSSPKPPPVDTPNSSPRPRIVYVRDFPTLAPSSSTWYPALLSAVRQRRRGPISRLSAPVPNPTVIVFGMTPPLTPSISTGAPTSNLMSYLMSRNSTAPVAPQDAKPEKVDWSESEPAEKARERRLQERLKKWEKHEAALFEEFPKLSFTGEEDGLEPQKPELIVVGPGGRGMPGMPPTPQLPRIGKAGDGEKKTSFFRSSVLVPAKRSHSQEKDTRMARRREINELSMRMGVGAVGGRVEATSAEAYFGEPIIQDAAEVKDDAPAETSSTIWTNWGNRIEVWPTVKKIADSAVGRVLASTVPSDKTLEPTVVPWEAIQSSWSTRKVLRDQRRVWLKDVGPHDLGETETPAEESATDELVEQVRNDPELDAYEQRLLGCIVDAASMPTSFSQVHLPPHTIDSVRTIVSLPLLHPHAFQHGILKQHSMSGCLLFGPPGTGKTLVVRALAKDAGCRMLAITPSDIMDMYVGEAEKLVRAVFSLSRRLSPCVVFLDEIDALFGARMAARESGGAATAHRGVITEFMQEMDGLKSSKEDGIVVIGATNRPFDLDDAVLRRLPRRLLVDLPGEAEREGILEILLRDETLASDVTLAMLAKKTESFSGSDLKHLCVSAALDAVKEHFSVPWKELTGAKKQEVEAPTSQSPAVESAAKATCSVSTAPESTVSLTDSAVAESKSEVEEVSTPEPHNRVLHLHNFTKALKEITPSSSESLGSLADLRKWNDEFGEGRKGKPRSPWGKGLFGFVDAKKPLPVSTEGKVAASTTTPPSSSTP
ncbi:hypothetical protein D9611_004624 [Ephemerocybe angulata]|uniref:AAA+ ATPase domain-containing protein n=1 Tax=Ephemerocybe angulata TaxID=980116 RepID=A0A8H5B375_9AGAR|nr:hypothetical protein D9611_004624 [Tulosesus angulatus]